MDRTPITKLIIALPYTDENFQQLRQENPEIEIVNCDRENIADHVGGAQSVWSWRFPAEAIPLATEVVWFHHGAAGVEAVITPEFRAQNWILTNSSGVSAPNMAEHCIAMLLSFARDIPRHVRNTERRKWRDEEMGSPDFELNGSTVFVLGTGAIGTELARRLHGFNCEIVGVRRNPQAPIDPSFDSTIGFDVLEQEIGRADHIVSSLPWTPDTDGIFSRAIIGACKPSAYFFNVGRGKTVDQDALMEALNEGRLAGAGLDVCIPEPLPDDSPLWTTRNVLITSHQSGGSIRTIERNFELARENLRRYKEGEELMNLVDQTAGY